VVKISQVLLFKPDWNCDIYFMETVDGNSYLEVLRDFARRAESLSLSYMVTGSFAMSAYGETRFTRDIDIVVEIRSEQADRFFNSFDGDYYISRNSIDRALQNESMFNIIHTEKAVKIDCIIRKNNEFEKLKFSHRREARIKDIIFWTITKEDLILSKLNWSKDSLSEMQIRDIANLTAGDYNTEYVTQWIEKLELNKIWQKVLEWKTQHKL
jgi:hypothetical protein